MGRFRTVHSLSAQSMRVATLIHLGVTGGLNQSLEWDLRRSAEGRRRIVGCIVDALRSETAAGPAGAVPMDASTAVKCASIAFRAQPGRPPPLRARPCGQYTSPGLSIQLVKTLLSEAAVVWAWLDDRTFHMATFDLCPSRFKAAEWCALCIQGDSICAAVLIPPPLSCSSTPPKQLTSCQGAECLVVYHAVVLFAAIFNLFPRCRMFGGVS